MDAKLVAPSKTRRGASYWLAGYASMLRFEFARQRQFLMLFLATQVLMGAGMSVMYGFFLPDIPDRVALFITTGVPTLALIPVGFLIVPQMISQQRLRAPTTSCGPCRYPRWPLLRPRSRCRPC